MNKVPNVIAENLIEEGHCVKYPKLGMYLQNTNAPSLCFLSNVLLNP